MKNIFTLLFLSVFFTCYGQGNLTCLKKAYKKNSLDLYNTFLTTWETDSKPVIYLDSMDSTKKDVYAIFCDFYTPFNLQRIINSGYVDRTESDEEGDEDIEEESELPTKLDYVIIQNTIYINILKIQTLDYDEYRNKDSLIDRRDSILDFRPDIKFNNAKTLYLIPKYQIIINKFLGSKSFPLGFGGIMNPSRARGESAKKLKFLNQKLRIIHGHWGGYWHIETHPQVFCIDFNRNKTMAKVLFRLGYQGGEAYYYKANGIWKLEKSQLTWIE